jgi:hypothetical protein
MDVQPESLDPGARGSPQLTRCLSRHAIPDTPEGPRAVYVYPISRDAGFPVEIAGRPPQLGVYEATSRFTRVTACRFASPPLETFHLPVDTCLRNSIYGFCGWFIVHYSHSTAYPKCRYVSCVRQSHSNRRETTSGNLIHCTTAFERHPPVRSDQSRKEEILCCTGRNDLYNCFYCLFSLFRSSAAAVTTG